MGVEFDLEKRAQRMFAEPDSWSTPVLIDKAMQLAREYADAEREKIRKRIDAERDQHDPALFPGLSRAIWLCSDPKPETLEQVFESALLFAQRNSPCTCACPELAADKHSEFCIKYIASRALEARQ